jgi:hypothetical protein
VSDIVAFVSARLDEDQADALAAQKADPTPWTAQVSTDGPWPTDHDMRSGAGLVVSASDVGLWDCEGSNTLCMAGPTSQHIARHDPARVLAEVKAKRAIVKFCDEDPLFLEGGWAYTDRVLRLMASAYADHPDYNPAWRVE